VDANAIPLEPSRGGVPAPGRLRRWLRGARIIHPFPTLLNVGATLGLALDASRGVPGGSVLTRMLLVMLLAQSAIGVANDVFDEELDRATKPWKPVAAGIITSQSALVLAAALIAVCAGLAATLGPASFGLAMLGLACGLAYDARLKRTVLSAVPYMVAIPALPLWVWATLGAWEPVLWWLFPVGALIGVALHLQNTLADIDADAAHGVIGLAHRLGPRRSMYVAWAAFGAALAWTLVLAPFVPYELRWYAPTAAAAALMLAMSVGAHALRRDAAALQVGFGLLGIASAVLAVGWLAAVTG
jgi:4-hydroxybenzoate polyprenyltransferase